ncbi:MAG: SoxR reducing system RseC family protein [Pseudomonadales bacterium]|jgi:sigma-E factor negative regulatory protein RseC|nr:SoxR reducing system RseC family protein [Pseudomonadales bacterium]
MIEEAVRIVGLEQDRVWVEARRQSACGRCAARAGCGHGLLDQIQPGPVMHLLLPRPAQLRGLEIGDRLVVGIEEQAILAASLRAYLLPLAGLLLGAISGDVLLGSDLGAGIAGGAGLAAGFAMLRVLDRLRPLPAPRILRRAEASGEPRPLRLVQRAEGGLAP